jgi:hypothetical protein
LVSQRGRPNRYASFLVVRSSEDRQPPLVVFATEGWGNNEARVCWGIIGAHLGLLIDDLVMVLGCGASKKLGDVIGEVNVAAAGS